MASYLQITPVAYTVLSEILASFNIEVDEPDSRKIARLLSPRKINRLLSPRKINLTSAISDGCSDCDGIVPMVSIPVQNADQRIVEEFRESSAATPVMEVSHEQVPSELEFADTQQPIEPSVVASTIDISFGHFNEVELAVLRQCVEMEEENMELAYLRTTLSLSIMEAEFLRMQLKLLNLKARSILELFQYCEGSNAGFCRCPEIRKRVYEMGILVQRQ